MAAPVDPFFHLTNDSEWNACIGRQATEENYVDGYIEAAIELASAVIDKGLHGQRDTLAMPILYNARHGLELALKLAINRLHEMGAIQHAHPKNHDIRSHWELLDQAGLGDVVLRRLVTDLRTYVDSLAKIDDDGQELRYAENQAGGKSLEDKALASGDARERRPARRDHGSLEIPGAGPGRRTGDRDFYARVFPFRPDRYR